MKLLLVIATGKEDVSDNPLLEFFMITSLFESLIKLLSTTAERQVHGKHYILQIIIILLYNKCFCILYRSVNNYNCNV